MSEGVYRKPFGNGGMNLNREGILYRG